MAFQGKQTAIRLSDKDVRIIDAIIEKKGGNVTTTIIRAVRELAEREGLLPPVELNLSEARTQ